MYVEMRFYNTPHFSNLLLRLLATGAKQSQTEDLKEMGDVSSGMASRVIQIYLKEILRSFLHRDTGVRMWAMRVVEIVLRQGLVHPVQIVPFLICLSTDPEREVSKETIGFFVQNYKRASFVQTGCT